MLQRSAGQPLDRRIAGQMRGAFGRSFAEVRVYADDLAAQSASAVGADAFTVGNDIVFAAGKYQPHSPAGIRLLAHELTHVVQQRGQPIGPQTQLTVSTPGDAGERQADAVAEAVMSGRPVSPIGSTPVSVQRACGPEMLGSPTPDCSASDAGVAGWGFMFKVNCDELLPGEEAKLSKLKPGSTLQIHGFASREGPPAFNADLSCHRANRIAALVRRLRPDCPIVGTFKHGASPVAAPGVVPDVNPASFWRTVIIQETQPTPQPPPSPADQPPIPKPGPSSPPTTPGSEGKQCKFYVYDDTTHDHMSSLWRIAAFGLASFRPDAYVIPSGDTIAEALKLVFDTYASKDCGCISEIQFFSHGSPGDAMSIEKTGEMLTIADFAIPGIEEFGYGPTSMPGYGEWHAGLTLRQRRLVLLRRVLCGPDAEVYYRSCDAFQGKKGQEFAKASAEFWRSTVIGHTKVIALTQPGRKELRPGQEPYWLESEGTEEPTAKKPIGLGAEEKPKKD